MNKKLKRLYAKMRKVKEELAKLHRKMFKTKRDFKRIQKLSMKRYKLLSAIRQEEWKEGYRDSYYKD